MKKFNERYTQLMEDIGAVGNTTSAAFGDGQAHPAQVGQSGDFYAPGDARNMFGTKKSKKKKTGFTKNKVIRRTFPGI